jgi:hypothetical protein
MKPDYRDGVSFPFNLFLILVSYSIFYIIIKFHRGERLRQKKFPFSLAGMGECFDLIPREVSCRISISPCSGAELSKRRYSCCRHSLQHRLGLPSSPKFCGDTALPLSVFLLWYQPGSCSHRESATCLPRGDFDSYFITAAGNAISSQLGSCSPGKAAGTERPSQQYKSHLPGHSTPAELGRKPAPLPNSETNRFGTPGQQFTLGSIPQKAG